MDAQGRYSFLVVSAGDKHRGPFAAQWLEDACRELDLDAVVLSAGLDVKKHDTRRPQQRSYPLTEEMAKGADLIIGMEGVMLDTVQRRYDLKEDTLLVSLDVPAEFRSTYVDEAVMQCYSPAQAMNHLRLCYHKGRIGPQLFAKVLQYHLHQVLRVLRSSQVKSRQMRDFGDGIKTR